MHAPLNAVIRFGKKAEERLIPVKLGARLTEIGTLETLVRFEDQRQPLAAAVRASQNRRRSSPSSARPPRWSASRRSQSSLELIQAVFSPTAKSPDRARRTARQARTDPGPRPQHLAALAPSARWPTRSWQSSDGRKKSPAYEIRWLNLAGFCLRPGFGYPGRRFPHRAGAPHLRRGSDVRQPGAVRNRLVDLLGPRRRRPESQSADRHLPAALRLPAAARQQEAAAHQSRLLREMWRTAASLELLPIGTKTELGEALVKRVKAGDFKESELWCLSRLGARKLFYGPINLVVPPATVTRWVEALLKLPNAGDALAAMARRTEDPTRDLPAPTRDAVRAKLQTLPHADRLLAVLEGEEEDERTLGRIFGEELPSGLVLAEQFRRARDLNLARHIDF